MSEHECIVCGNMHDPERAEQAERALGEFRELYPDLRQLIQGFRQEAESWSEWDRSVNDRLMALGRGVFNER